MRNPSPKGHNFGLSPEGNSTAICAGPDSAGICAEGDTERSHSENVSARSLIKECTFPHCSCEYHCDGPKPVCAYCDQTEGLRLYHDGGGYIPQDYICEDCFTPRDDGPCFDDLPALEPKS